MSPGRVNVKFTLDGDARLLAALKRQIKVVPRAVKKHLEEEAEKAIALAKAKFVPIELGTLANSGSHTNARKVGNKISVSMGFGGPEIDYAVAIHEHPSASSPPSWVGVEVKFSPPGTGPKYLERAVRERSVGMKRRIGQAIESEMRRSK